MDKQHAQSGSYTVAATPALVTITLGFKPRYVEVININDLEMHKHWLGMADDSSIQFTNHDTTQISSVTSNSITLTSNGFTVGTAIGDTASDVVRWVAFR